MHGTRLFKTSRKQNLTNEFSSPGASVGSREHPRTVWSLGGRAGKTEANPENAHAPGAKNELVQSSQFYSTRHTAFQGNDRRSGWRTTAEQPGKPRVFAERRFGRATGK